jgi:glycyl-tRNA synthetase (class II)
MQHEKFYNLHKTATGKVQFMLSKIEKRWRNEVKKRNFHVLKRVFFVVSKFSYF